MKSRHEIGFKSALQSVRTSFQMAKQLDTPRILLADADPLTNEMLKLFSEAQSYRFIPVTNGREAFRLLRHDANFDLAILDSALTQPHSTDLLLYMKTEKRLVR